MVLRLFTAAMMILFASMPTSAQEASYRQAENPYQEEVRLFVGVPVEPGVEIAGVQWQNLLVRTKSGGDPKAGDETPVVVELDFENRGDTGATLTVVVLLENGDGDQLERLSLPKLRLGGARAKTYREKFTVPGDDLLATRRAYLFCRVE
jgi:hypothetical protein